MRISFTIEIDDVRTSDVKVQSADVKVQDNMEEKGEEKITREWIGEGRPGNHGKGKHHLLKGAASYPYIAAQVKDFINKAGVTIPAIAREIGMDPITFRNLLRRDDRGFTEEDYNVIIKAVQEIKDNEEKEII